MFRKSAILFQIVGMALCLLLVHQSGFCQTPQKKVKVNILASRTGLTSYVACFALADLINKHSAKLQAAAVETKGAHENLAYIADSPDMRKNSIVYATMADARRAMLGMPPYRQPQKGLKAVAQYGSPGAFFWCTYDSRIKTPADLRGKRLGVDDKLNAFHYVAIDLLKEWGLDSKKDVRLSGIGPGAMQTALTDGTIDAAYFPAGLMVRGSLQPNPLFQELLAARTLFIPFGVEKKTIDGHNAKTGDWWVWSEIKADAIKKDLPSKPTGIITNSFPWWAHASMDPDTIYEVTRIIAEHAPDFGTYHAALKGMNKATVADIPPLVEGDFHDGALKYYREIKVK